MYLDDNKRFIQRRGGRADRDWIYWQSAATATRAAAKYQGKFFNENLYRYPSDQNWKTGLTSSATASTIEWLDGRVRYTGGEAAANRRPADRSFHR
jgi:hypothetical protein